MEKWRDITGYEGQYQVSNIGRVKSLSRTIVIGNYGTFRVMPEAVMNQYDHYQGYKCVYLRNGKERRMKFFVHRLVACAFIENTDTKPIVNHKDLNKANNHITNLEWMTLSENTQHYYDSVPKQVEKPLVAADLPW